MVSYHAAATRRRFPHPLFHTHAEEVLKNGLLLRTPRGDDEHIKLWIAGSTIHYRLLQKLTPKPRGKSGTAGESRGHTHSLENNA